MPAPPHRPDPYDARSLESLRPLTRYHAWIRACLGDILQGRVLEVGAGTGNFAETWVDDVDEALLLEPDAALRDRLVRRLGGRPDVRVMGDTLDDAAATLGPGGLDAVVMVNVLEHLDDDVGALSTARRMLRPGGALGLFVPALPALYGSLDALVGHRRRYTPATLRAAVEGAGFGVARLVWFDLAGVVPWWLVGRVLRARSFDGPLGPLYDRLVVPLAQPLEARVPPPIGKNLLCVARPLPAGAS